MTMDHGEPTPQSDEAKATIPAMQAEVDAQKPPTVAEAAQRARAWISQDARDKAAQVAAMAQLVRLECQEVRLPVHVRPGWWGRFWKAKDDYGRESAAAETYAVAEVAPRVTPGPCSVRVVWGLAPEEYPEEEPHHATYGLVLKLGIGRPWEDTRDALRTHVAEHLRAMLACRC